MEGESKSAKTLIKVYKLLHEKLYDFFQISDNILESREKRVVQSRARKSLSVPLESNTSYMRDKSTSTGTGPLYTQKSKQCFDDNLKDESGTKEKQSNKNSVEAVDYRGENHDLMSADCQSNVQSQNSTPTQSKSASVNVVNAEDGNEFTLQQNLDLMREMIELKIKMQELQKVVKLIPNEDENTQHQLTTMNEILAKIIQVQNKSEVLCDQLCEGLSKTTEPCQQLPTELIDFCTKISKVIGPKYRQVGQELHLTDDEINCIESDYEDNDTCLQQIVLDWINRSDDPSYHDLLTACRNVDPKVLKFKPLDRLKVKVLENSYSCLCDEIIDVPLLPHLISAGVMSFKLQRYVLQPNTIDQRMSRLINIVCTRENGFDELIKALDNTDQHHVSAFLMNTLEKMTHSKDSEQLDEHPIELQESINWTKKRKRCSSIDSLLDGRRSSVSIIAPLSSCAAIPDAPTLLLQIHQMITQVLNVPSSTT